MKSDWSDLDSDTVNNTVLATLVLGGLFVGIGMCGCCTFTCRCRRAEYLFVLVVVLTMAATVFSITQVDIITADLGTDPYPSAAQACTAELTQAETDFQENFNDLYVNFQANNERYRFFYEWYGDNCVADIGNGVCSCDETMDMDGGGTVEECPSFKDDVCECCDAYVCCKQNINMFIIDKLGFLTFGFYGLAAVQGIIILFTIHHIWNTVDKTDAHLLSNRGTDLSGDDFYTERRTSVQDREILRRASSDGRVTGSVEMGQRQGRKQQYIPNV